MQTSIRAAGIKSLNKARGGLGASEDHGKRLDETSQRRIVRERNSLNWSKAGEGRGLDLVDAFKAHKKELGAKERNNCEIGTHLLVTISPEWLAEAGDVHDPKNERVLKLIEEAKAWVENWQGEGSVFGWRFDLDEKGSGVVDLFTAPVRDQGRRGGKRVLTIAPNAAKIELTKSTGEKTSGAAFQTSWANWAQQRLDPRFERGKRKSETGRTHVHAEVYAEEAEKARRKAQELAEDTKAREGRLEALKAAQVAKEAELRRLDEEIDKRQSEAVKIAQEAEKQREKKLTLFNRTEIIQEELEKQKQITADAEAWSKEIKNKAYEDRRKAREEREQAERHHNYERNLRNREIDAINEYPELKHQNQSLKNQIKELKSTKSAEHCQLEQDHSKLKTEIKETQKQLRAFKTIFELMKTTFKSLFPSHYAEVAKAVNPEWEKHPDNPNQKSPQSSYSPSSFSP